jgi:diguanylate cyclase
MNMSDGTAESGILSPERPEGLIDRLLAILADITVEADALKTDEFRARLKTCRKHLAASFGTPDFAAYSTDCLRTCEEYFNLSRKYLLERESAFGEVIQVLRESIGHLAGESGSFNSQLIRTSERFSRLTEIEDIRKLKKQIALECFELKRIVVEKQQKDEASYSRLSRRVELLQGSLEQSREEASLDGLTRIANRNSFDKALSRWIAAHNQAKKHFVLALFDLDNFKAVNDKYGHQVGDRVLLCAAQWFRKDVRVNDFLARFGGEEFAILLSDATTDQADKKFTSLLENIAVSSYKYTVAGNVSHVRFTVSCGIAEFEPEESAENLIRRADAALYEAKHRGKNCAVVAGPPQKSRGLWNSLQPLIPFKI